MLTSLSGYLSARCFSFTISCFFDQGLLQILGRIPLWAFLPPPPSFLFFSSELKSEEWRLLSRNSHSSGNFIH